MNISPGDETIKYVKISSMQRVLDFLTGVRVELSKVVWPTPETTIKLTVIVILVTITVGFFVGAIDFILTKLLELILTNK